MTEIESKCSSSIHIERLGKICNLEKNLKKTANIDLCNPKTWFIILCETVFSLGKSGLVFVANFSTSKPINTIGIAAKKLDTGNNWRTLFECHKKMKVYENNFVYVLDGKPISSPGIFWLPCQIMSSKFSSHK